MILGCQACIEAFKSAGGQAAGWSIAFMLVIVALMMTGVGVCMARIGARQKAVMPDKYRDPLNDK